MENCKEYLEKQPDGKYALVLRGDLCKESDILIPEGAEVATLDGKALYFWKPSENKTFVDDHWVACGTDVCSFDDFTSDERVLVIWQRATHPEELPFIDDEPKYTDDEVKYMNENGQGRLQSLNDQYEEIEQVGQQTIEATLAERQSTYGNFEDVAFVTENIMSILAKVRVNGLDDLPNTHRMALYMIASKMARIVNGDFNHLDSWHDIGGYSKLIEKLIKGE